MNRHQPHILVVGTGSSGGIGRFERLLMTALEDLEQREVFRVDSIWRRSHPGYLQTSTNRSALEGEQSETRMSVYVAQIATAVLRHRPDLVLFLHINLARAAPIARILGRRYAITTYGVEVWAPLDRLRRRALRSATEVLAISEYTAEQLKRHQQLPPNPVRVIPLALEPHWLQEAAPSSQPSERPIRGKRTHRLLSVSRLEPTARDKGIEQVIRSLPVVRATIPEASYHVVGEGQDRAYLEKVARDSGVADAVVFRGLISHEELIEEYRQAEVFVLPSQREGFGLVFLEAMAYAVPVVARRAAAAVEVIADGHTGILADDERDLAPAIISMLSDYTRAQAMGRSGLERVRKVYSFAAFTSRLEAALLAVVD